MTSDEMVVLKLLSMLTEKISSSDVKLNAQEIKMSLDELQGMSGQHVEVLKLNAALEEKRWFCWDVTWKH